MDKIRLSLSGSNGDFARLYNWSGGFHGNTEHVAFPGEQSLTLFLISMAGYSLTVEGDASLEHDAAHGDHHMHFYGASWSDEAKARGTGRATIKMVHPDHADQPYVFELTMGEFRHHSDATTKPADPDRRFDPRTDLGVQSMLAQEMAHAWMGDVVGSLV